MYAGFRIDRVSWFACNHKVGHPIRFANVYSHLNEMVQPFIRVNVGGNVADDRPFIEDAVFRTSALPFTGQPLGS